MKSNKGKSSAGKNHKPSVPDAENKSVSKSKKPLDEEEEMDDDDTDMDAEDSN